MYGARTKKLMFGLDYDDTVTENPALFLAMVKLIQEYGCDVLIVTARQQSGWDEGLRKFHAESEIDVIFTGAKAKCDIVGIDIWIDDFPLAITHDFKEFGWRPSESTKKDIV